MLTHQALSHRIAYIGGLDACWGSTLSVLLLLRVVCTSPVQPSWAVTRDLHISLEQSLSFSRLRPGPFRNPHSNLIRTSTIGFSAGNQSAPSVATSPLPNEPYTTASGLLLHRPGSARKELSHCDANLVHLPRTRPLKPQLIEWLHK